MIEGGALVWIGMAGLAIGAGMGLYAIVNPRWASWLVRLRDDPERPGGAAEFRGTYGGLFAGAHGLTLAMIFTDSDPGVIVGALIVCAMVWWGTAVGRLVSIVVDRSGLPFNIASVIFELALGAAVAAPVLANLRAD